MAAMQPLVTRLGDLEIEAMYWLACDEGRYLLLIEARNDGIVRCGFCSQKDQALPFFSNKMAVMACLWGWVPTPLGHAEGLRAMRDKAFGSEHSLVATTMGDDGVPRAEFFTNCTIWRFDATPPESMRPVRV